jgi:hypothetical protein
MQPGHAVTMTVFHILESTFEALEEPSLVCLCAHTFYVVEIIFGIR